MKLRKVTVRIARHAGVDIEKSVPAWEVRVLNAIFGEPNVVQVGSEEYDGTFNARDEFDALIRKYGTATDGEGGQIIYTAYRDSYELEQAFNRMRESWGHDTPIAPRRGRPPKIVEDDSSMTL